MEKQLSELTYYLASLYYRDEDIFAVVEKVPGVKIQFINFASKPVTFWTNIVRYISDKADGIKNLLETVLNDGHEDDAYLKALLSDPDTTFKNPFSGKADETVAPDKRQLEKLTKGKSTLLAISFLQKGVIASKKVVHIETGKSMGTGFLLGNKYLLTNNHVIPDIETAKTAKILFNFELPEAGITIPPMETFGLDPAPDHHFATSVKNDWTVVKLKDYPDDYLGETKYGFLQLSDTRVRKDDFVNIIQHPEGRHKQIALYHNMVVSVSDERVLYLTDTLKGSSGSPVFNSDWQVVALHHAGFPTKINNEEQIVNEGIPIGLVLNEITANGITL